MSLTSLQTAVLGPVENGRGYTILARSNASGPDAAVEGMLRHFSLALAGWADRHPANCVVMFPLDAATETFAVARVANPEAVLAAAIEGMEPPQQRARLTGWSTSAAFTRSGAFDPDAAFRLIVRADGQGDAAASVTRRVARLSQGKVSPLSPADASTTPSVWRVWAQVGSVAQAFGKGGALHWQPRYADHAPDAVAAIAILEACLDLYPIGRAALLSAVAEASEDSDIGGDLLGGAAVALGRLMDQPGEAEGAAWYLNDYVEANADRPAAVTSVAHLALRDGVLPWMSAQSLDLLAFSGLADRLASHNDYSLDSLPAPARVRLLKAAIQKPGVAERRALTVRLIGLCLPEPGGAKPCAQAIAALLALPAGPGDAALAIPEIYDLLQVGGAAVRAAYARRVLSPILTNHVRLAKEPYVIAMKTALRAVSGGAR